MIINNLKNVGEKLINIIITFLEFNREVASFAILV